MKAKIQISFTLWAATDRVPLKWLFFTAQTAQYYTVLCIYSRRVPIPVIMLSSCFNDFSCWKKVCILKQEKPDFKKKLNELIQQRSDSDFECRFVVWFRISYS